MLDHDELLPIEQDNPNLVRELRTVYRVTPEEQRVPARVFERLAMYSYPLPVQEHEHEPASTAYGSRPLQLVSPVATLEKPFRTRRRWLQNLNAIAGVLFLVLLIGSLVFAFTATHHTSVGSFTESDMHISLVPAESFSKFSRNEMQAEATILSQRFSTFGLRGSSVHVQMIHGQLGLMVSLPHFGNIEQQTINTLLQVGVLDFWNTGPSSNQNAILAQGTPFHPNQYIQYNPGGHPLFTNRDLDPTTLSVDYDPQTGHPQIDCEMKGSATGRFGTFTAKYVDYGLTMTLDGKVLSSANIQSAINGPFVITGNFTPQQAQALVSVLKYAPLSFALKQVS